MLPQGEGHVVKHTQVGEQSAELKQHAQTTTQAKQGILVSGVDPLSVEADRAFLGRINTANQAQQGGFATARAAQNGSHLAPRKLQRHIVQNDTPTGVAKGHVIDGDQCVSGRTGAQRSRRLRRWGNR